MELKSKEISFTATKFMKGRSVSKLSPAAACRRWEGEDKEWCPGNAVLVAEEQRSCAMVELWWWRDGGIAVT